MRARPRSYPPESLTMRDINHHVANLDDGARAALMACAIWLDPTTTWTARQQALKPLTSTDEKALLIFLEAALMREPA